MLFLSLHSYVYQFFVKTYLAVTVYAYFHLFCQHQVSKKGYGVFLPDSDLLKTQSLKINIITLAATELFSYGKYNLLFYKFFMFLHENVQLSSLFNLYVEGLIPYFIQEGIYDRRKLQLPNQSDAAS